MSKPINEADEVCPFHQKPVKKVCHKCPLYILVRGKDPTNDRDVDHWGCSFAFMPLLTIENSNMQRQTGAAVESFRNEMVKGQEMMVKATLLSSSPRADTKLLEG